MKLRGMNERVQKLRQQSVEAPAHIYIERANLMTDAYMKYEGSVSIPELRALAFKHFMENKKLCINDGELIVGEKGDAPQSSPTFPELCCHTLEDMHIMNNRELIGFSVTEEDLELQKSKIIPYWEKRSVRNKIINSVSSEWRECYESGIFTEFMEQRGPGHTVASFEIYTKGFNDYKKEIEEEINNLDFANDVNALKKREQLNSMSIACDAIIILGKRYSLLAKELAEKEDDPIRKEELLQIAKNCETVPANKPKTYWQAIQMYWFIHLGVTTELNPWDAYSPGRLDQHLNPFYLEDCKNNILDEYKAKELLECLWVKFNNQPAPPKVGVTLKESSTYTDFVNINSGGITANGQDGVNDISYLILECMDEMKLLQPSSNVQISKKTPKNFLKKACEVSRKGWGQPAFYNTEAIIQELLNAGKTIEDARLGGTSGCVETGAFGSEAYILTGYFNLPKILELTLFNGFDKISQKQLGLELGFAKDFKSYDDLLNAFKKQVEYFIDIKLKGSNIIEKIYAEYMPVPFLSVITNDCISTGKDYNAGGARYNINYVQGVGIGTITDSLSAIKYNVFDKNIFTMDELVNSIENNFENNAIIHNFVSNKTPKYGNDDDFADEIMIDIFNHFKNYVNGKPNMKGGSYRINMLPTTCHVYFGEIMLASADGRLAGKPLSEGISPSKGGDTKGPTAVVKSAAKMDHLSTGGTLLNQKFTPNVVAGEEGLNHMANLIRSYFDMDGHHIQFNVIDRETLIKAQKNPQEYKDLIVRVAGYSDHFRNLSKSLQDEIIERTEQNFN